MEGLIHVSESGLEASVKLEEKFKLQDDVTAKIIKVDREERKIALSLRDHQLDWERKQVDDYHSAQGVLDQSLGEPPNRAGNGHNRKTRTKSGLRVYWGS